LFSRFLSALALITAILPLGNFMFSPSTHSAEAAASKPIRWGFFSGPALAAIAADAAASQLLDQTRPFVAKRLSSPIPPGWNAVPLAPFKSFEEIRSALSDGTIERDVQGVMYDNERWQFTPVEEQKNPAWYERQAADLAHRHGLLFLAVPAVNLVTVLEPEGRGQPFETYLRLEIAADAARYADIFAIQAQSSESDPQLYGSFVRAAAAQARKANPKVLVLAVISTDPTGQRASAEAILGAIAAAHDAVDGYWFNITSPGRETALEVLRRLAIP
jgi:hypothetical protein